MKIMASSKYTVPSGAYCVTSHFRDRCEWYQLYDYSGSRRSPKCRLFNAPLEEVGGEERCVMDTGEVLYTTRITAWYKCDECLDAEMVER